MDSRKKHDFSPASLFLAVCKAQIPAILTGMILLFLFCLIAYNTTDPDSIILPLSMVAMLLSALAGGIAARRFSGDGVIAGLASGVLTMVLYRVITALPLPDAGVSTEYTLLLACLIPAASVCGAVIGKKKKSTKRRHHR